MVNKKRKMTKLQKAQMLLEKLDAGETQERLFKQIIKDIKAKRNRDTEEINKVFKTLSKKDFEKFRKFNGFSG